MKMKIIIALVAIVGTLGLAGCKPKPITLTGQVFIATQGGDNVKLGDVEILLIEKSQANDFFQKIQPIIESEMTSRRQALVIAKQEVENVQADYDLFVTNNRPHVWVMRGSREFYEYGPFFSNTLFYANTNCAKIRSQAENLLRQVDTFDRLSDQLNGQAKLAEAQGNQEKADALNKQADTISSQRFNKQGDLDGLIEKLEDAVNLAKADKVQKLEVAKSQLIATEKKLAKFPSGEDYLMNFSPVVIQKTLSDADGRFSFVYPRDKSLTIYASAQRMILNGTEKYYWLIDAPTNAEATQVFLSNNNLVFVDPDGYFKIKPQ